MRKNLNKIFITIFVFAIFYFSLSSCIFCCDKEVLSNFIQWSSFIGNAGTNVYLYDIAIDSEGYLYVIGYTNGSITDISINGYNDLLIAKYDNQGNRIWLKLIGKKDFYTKGSSITIDKEDNIYVTGWTNANLTNESFDECNSAFVIKLNKNGNILWTKQFGATDLVATGNDIAIDSFSNVYLLGVVQGEGILYGQKLKGKNDSFLVKYDRDGNMLWFKLYGVENSYLYSNSINIDKNNNIYISGKTYGNFDENNVISGFYDLFILKLDSDGNKIWTKLLGAKDKETEGNDICFDENANLYVLGNTNANLDGQVSTGYTNILIVKYDIDGNKIWTKIIGNSKVYVETYKITVDKNDYIYALGVTDGSLENQCKIGILDFYLIKLDSNGNKIFTRLFGQSKSNTFGYGLNFDKNNNLYICGFSDGSFFGHSKIGEVDSFIVRLK